MLKNKDTNYHELSINMYDLAGRRVKAANGNSPARDGLGRGVYIDVNGKKVCK